ERRFRGLGASKEVGVRPTLTTRVAHTDRGGGERVCESSPIFFAHQRAVSLGIRFETAVEDELNRYEARRSKRVLGVDPRLRRRGRPDVPYPLDQLKKNECRRRSV